MLNSVELFPQILQSPHVRALRSGGLWISVIDQVFVFGIFV